MCIRDSLWAINADIYSSDSLVNQIINHKPAFLLPYNHTLRLKTRLDGIIYPPIISLNGIGSISSWQNYSVSPGVWKNSGFWPKRNPHLLCSLLSLSKELMKRKNESNVVAMLVYGTGQCSDISWIPRALRANWSPITDILFFHIDSNDFSDECLSLPSISDRFWESYNNYGISRRLNI